MVSIINKRDLAGSRENPGYGGEMLKQLGLTVDVHRHKEEKQLTGSAQERYLEIKVGLPHLGSW